jgi:hypothetical protein
MEPSFRKGLVATTESWPATASTYHAAAQEQVNSAGRVWPGRFWLGSMFGFSSFEQAIPLV